MFLGFNALHTLQRIIISLYSLWSICTDFEMYRLKTVFFFFFANIGTLLYCSDFEAFAKIFGLFPLLSFTL